VIVTPPDEVHDEERPAGGGRAGVQHAGDIGVVHKGQGLPLGLEPRDYLGRVHPRLDQFDRDQPLDRLLLLGHPHRAHPALANRFEQLVATGDQCPNRLGRDRLVFRRGEGVTDRPFEEPAHPWLRQEESFDFVAEVGVGAAGLGDEGRAIGVGLAQGVEEHLFDASRVGHEWSPRSRRGLNLPCAVGR
jgi:hypothetical protein